MLTDILSESDKARTYPAVSADDKSSVTHAGMVVGLSMRDLAAVAGVSANMIKIMELVYANQRRLGVCL